MSTSEVSRRDYCRVFDILLSDVYPNLNYAFSNRVEQLFPRRIFLKENINSNVVSYTKIY